MQIINVSDVTRYIKGLFDRDHLLGMLYIRGEVSNFKRHYSGHCYFTLKDPTSTIRAVMFKSRASLMKFAPYDGLKVVAGGRITVFERDGQYQLYVEQLVPDGVGELGLAYQQLKDKLTAEGLFAPSRKKSLPLLPKTIGIITSPTGAALRDIVTVSKRRNPNITLIVYPVQVQGAEAPPQIAQAIGAFNRLYPVDVIIMGRGGGSSEELWAFNDERVVRAVAASKIPLVSAVGHQTDYTLADFAADCRAATPSQAAEIVVPDRIDLQRQIATLRVRLERHMRLVIRNAAAQVAQFRERRIFRRPLDLLVAKQQALDILSQQLLGALRRLTTAKRHDLQVLAGKLDMLSPLAVLSRGYSIVRFPDGHILQAARDTSPGQKLEVILHHGWLAVGVLTVRGDERDGGEKIKV
jgi:exodeoxyribonuclease VII large subunit